MGDWDEALEMLGEVNPFRGRENEPRMTIFALILLIRLIASVPQYLSSYLIRKEAPRYTFGLAQDKCELTGP